LTTTSSDEAKVLLRDTISRITASAPSSNQIAPDGLPINLPNGA
jgi:hypothetical protein